MRKSASVGNPAVVRDLPPPDEAETPVNPEFSATKAAAARTASVCNSTSVELLAELVRVPVMKVPDDDDVEDEVWLRTTSGCCWLHTVPAKRHATQACAPGKYRQFKPRIKHSTLDWSEAERNSR